MGERKAELKDHRAAGADDGYDAPVADSSDAYVGAYKPVSLLMTLLYLVIIVSFATGAGLLYFEDEIIDETVKLPGRGGGGEAMEAVRYYAYLNRRAEELRWVRIIGTDLIALAVVLLIASFVPPMLERSRRKERMRLQTQKAHRKKERTREFLLKKAPYGLWEVYVQFLDDWRERGWVRWGDTGFTLRVHGAHGLQTALEVFPEWAVSLIRQADARDLGVGESDYSKYIEAVSSVPHAVDLLSAGERYIKHDLLTPDRLTVILTATTELAETFSHQLLRAPSPSPSPDHGSDELKHEGIDRLD